MNIRHSEPKEASVTPARVKEPDEYHHGDLRAALVDVSVDLVREDGIASFSMADASRHLGVSAPASYRHFASRDELLVHVAARVSNMLTGALQSAAATASGPDEALTFIAAAYVRFAAAEPELFAALLAVARQKHEHRELEEAAGPLAQTFLGPALQLCDGDLAEAERLVVAVLATGHGHAALLVEGLFGEAEDEVDTAVTRVMTAVRALIRGWGADE
jgi:AcrR family transcriptional regulator